VRLVLSTPSELPGPPRFLAATLVPTHLPKEGRPDFDSLPFAPGTGEALVRATEPGQMRVLFTSGSGTIARSARVADLGRDVLVEVADTPTEQRIEIELTAEELENLMRAGE
jgi:hypothetical protein